ncbi:hypothetical protein POTOM_044868 [Populus tomentosa]|uniref:Serine hydrolase domain-containing protein n=1 Tax=Populus tomentosa TaxID=118781 RepID=A0A8X7YKY7_POPTO|nr:hypothetical protein POTOM_044868 [Populus tomentosa]
MSCIAQQWQTSARINKTEAKKSKNSMVSFFITNKQKSLISIHFSPSTTPTAPPSLSLALSTSLSIVLMSLYCTRLNKPIFILHPKNIEPVKAFSLFEGTDFELASCHFPLNDKVAHECGFTFHSFVLYFIAFWCGWELVTFSPYPLAKAPDVSNAGRHLSAAEFHSVLQNAGKLGDEEIVADDKGIALEESGLFGGIRRYLEQFPDGGFSKEIVLFFITKFSVRSSDTNILGTCLFHGLSFDSSRCVCSCCRMLVFVCDCCRKEEAVFVCELCLKHGKGVESIVAENGEQLDILPQFELKTIFSNTILLPQLLGGLVKVCARPSIKLRILCMHGFRQNASGFRRTASLAKKLKSIVELIFVDAPHELPFIYLPVFSELECSDESSLSSQQFLPSTETCRGKLARLIAPDCEGRSVTDWKKADSPFDPLRYQQQTEGFNVSPSYLKTVFSQDGPFDGILGFS